MTRARSLALALAVSSLAAAPPAGRAAPPEDAHPASSRAEWVELVRRYARGDRTEAIAELGAWKEGELVRQVVAAEEAARASERCSRSCSRTLEKGLDAVPACPACASWLDGVPLRAAVLLLWDRDRAEGRVPLPGEVEQPRRCPGPTAGLAGRLARVLSQKTESSGFARRFFRMVVLQCQWDACFADAERWASDAILSFPRDTELLVARGSVREEVATIGVPCPLPGSFTLASRSDSGFEAASRDRLEKARRDFTDALALDPGLGLARLRLGRVLWRLGEPELARQQLDAVLASAHPGDPSTGPVDLVYLAHLFLGRIHQDAGRLPEATREYTLAASLRPGALSAGTALSNALLLAGDAEGARQALRQGLGSAGHRSERDPLWDYLVLNAAGLAELVETVHRESLE